MYLLFPVYFAIIKITHNEFKENAMDPQIILLKQSELSAEKESELCLLLSEEERTDLNKIRDTARRQLKLHAHARLREEAARLMHMHPADLVFSKGEHGKPFLMQDEELHFSLSYTKDAAVIALAGQPIGIDIEKIRPHRMRFAKNLGTPHELSVLRAAPDDLMLFYTFWTRKEAWLKLTGSGLTVPLTSFDVWDGPVAARLSTFRKDDYCISFCM